MKSDRLMVLACTAGLLVGACADDPASQSGAPTAPSFKPAPATACDLISGAIGDVFAGNAKNDFGDLLGQDDGSISATDAFSAASAISVAFDGRAAGNPLSEATLNSTYASWDGTLDRNATPAYGALLTRLIFECATIQQEDGDKLWTNSDRTNDQDFDWDGLEAEVAQALNQGGGVSLTDGYGAFAVRETSANGAVASPDYTNGPYWYVRPQDGDMWGDVFGQEALIYGYGRLRYDENEVPLGGSYEWLVFPRFNEGFLTDAVVVTCQDPQGGQGQTGARIQRAGNVLTNFTGGGDLCTFPPPPGQASEGTSMLSRLARAVVRVFTPPPLHADAAVAVGGGFGGFISKWSPVDPSFISAVELVFDNQPCKDQLESTADGSVTNPLGFTRCKPQPDDQLRVIAQTSNGSPIEEIEIWLSAVDNNGQDKGLGKIVNGTCDPSVDIFAVTQNDASDDAGVAVFQDLCVVGRGGFRLQASVPASTDYAPVDSDGFNVRPAN